MICQIVIWRGSKKMKLNIGFIFGGNSTEHEISIISAVQAMNNLDNEKYNVVPIYLTKDGKFYYSEEYKKVETFKDLNTAIKRGTEILFTKKDGQLVLFRNSFPYKAVKNIDIIFPVLHGYNTEDGSIAGYLELLGVPYCESDIYASSIGQDKIMQKMVLRASGVNVCDYCYFYESDYQKDSAKVIQDVMQIPFPLIVKPARQGSSVGIGIAHNKDELIEKIETALEYDEKILVEEVVEDLQELNIAVLGDNYAYELSDIEEVYGKDEILSYQDKYLSGAKGSSKGMASTGRKIPADIEGKIKAELEDMAYKTAKALNISGVVRIDFMLNKKTNKLYLNEVNIIPGSLAFYLWKSKGLEYKDLLDKIINLGIKKFQNKDKKLSSFTTNVLANFNGTKGIKK